MFLILCDSSNQIGRRHCPHNMVHDFIIARHTTEKQKKSAVSLI